MQYRREICESKFAYTYTYYFFVLWKQTECVRWPAIHMYGKLLESWVKCRNLKFPLLKCILASLPQITCITNINLDSLVDKNESEWKMSSRSNGGKRRTTFKEKEIELYTFFYVVLFCTWTLAHITFNNECMTRARTEMVWTKIHRNIS